VQNLLTDFVHYIPMMSSVKTRQAPLGGNGNKHVVVQDDWGTKAKMAGVAEYRRYVMAAGSTVPIGMVRVP